MFKTSSFRSRQFLTIMGLAAILLLFTMGVALPATRNFVVRSNTDQLSLVADQNTANIEAWLGEGREAATLIAEYPNLSNLVSALAYPERSNSAQEKIIDSLNQVRRFFPEIQSVSLLDPQEGNVILSTDPALFGRLRGEEIYFQPAHNDLFISPVEYSTGRESPILVLATPLKDDAGNLISIVSIEMQFENLASLLSDQTGLGETGRVYLVNQYGFYITLPPVIQGKPLAVIAESEGITKAVAHQNGSGFYDDPNQTRVLGIYRWLPELSLGLLVEINEEEIAAGYQSLWASILIGELVLFALAAIASLSLSQLLVAPIEKISAAARSLQAGDLSHRADTTGPDEISELAAVFNEMADSLQQSYENQEEIIQQRTLLLQQAEAQLESIIQTAPDAIITLDEDHQIIIFNNAAELIFACRVVEALGKRIDRFIPELYQTILAQPAMDNLSPGLHPQPLTALMETTALTWSGEEFPVETSFSKVKVEGKYILSIILRDITARKQTQEKIKASLQEKEVLLKEIHHRVKNNLQIISSLLYLQSKRIKDEDTIRLFQDGRNRVQAMALIHEKLYQSPDMSTIDFEEYIQSLVADLTISFGLTSRNAIIKIEIQPISLDLDKAITCGLITNELVSNALKYAFPTGEPGIITISLSKVSDESCQFIIHDNGVGFNADLDSTDPDTLGLELVVNLVGRIDGALTVDASEGTRFEITFPI